MPASASIPTSTLAMVARWSSHPGLIRLGASLLGAVTAVGAFVLLAVGLLATVLLIGRVRDTSPGGIVSGLASGAAPISVIGALTLSGIVVVSFACGGFVACRITDAPVQTQSLAVWGWAVLLPALFLLGALLSVAREVVSSVPVTGALVLFLATLATMALLGCMLGGETARRARGAAAARA
ncbi:MAG: hypothetical protein ACT4QG_03795 [Sporichthyaceae bacterium]